MRVFFLLYFTLVLLVARVVWSLGPNGYNEKLLSPDHAVAEFINVAFPDVVGRESDHESLRLVAGNWKKAKVVVLPDLGDGISTRASMVWRLRQEKGLTDAILFFHDAIDLTGIRTHAPQSFPCYNIVYRAPSYIDQAQFKSALASRSVPIVPKMRLWDDNMCYRLGLEKATPALIKSYIEEIARENPDCGRYFVIIDQRQMPDQQDAQSTVKDWYDIFGNDGFMMLKDQYAHTSKN